MDDVGDGLLIYVWTPGKRLPNGLHAQPPKNPVPSRSSPPINTLQGPPPGLPFSQSLHGYPPRRHHQRSLPPQTKLGREESRPRQAHPIDRWPGPHRRPPLPGGKRTPTRRPRIRYPPHRSRAVNLDTYARSPAHA